MTQDTRKDRRVKIVSLNVRYKSATVDEFIDNHAHDVSRGGIYIKTSSPFPPGTLLKFEIRLASDLAVIAGVGRVVWKRDPSQSVSEQPAGMGVKFIKLDDPSRAVIDKLVNTKADAGKAYESTAEAPSTAPVAKPGGSTSLGPSPNAAAVASLAPRGAAATAGKGTPLPRPSASATPMHRKATMMGIGIPSAPPAAPPVTAAPIARATAAPSVTPLPPRPGGPSISARPPGAMFPKTTSEAELPPKQEQTVMRQAAELLEEALREAGGSMDDVGANPLFSGGEPVAAPAAMPTSELMAAAPSPGEPPKAEPALLDDAQKLDFEAPKPAASKGADEATAKTTPDDAEKARAMVAEMSPAPVPRRLSDPPRTARETPIAKVASERAPAARASDAPAAKKKGGASGLVWALIAVAAIAGGVVTFRDKLFGANAAPSPAPTPAVTLSAAPPASASAAPATSSAAETPSTSAMPASPSASAEPTTSASAAPSAVVTAGKAVPSWAGARATPAGGANATAVAPKATTSAAREGSGSGGAANAEGSPPDTAALAHAAAPAASPNAEGAATAATKASAPTTAKPKPKPAADDNPY